VNTFGNRSRAALETSHPVLQQAAEIVLQLKDHSVLKGFRGQAEQDQAFADGHSKVQWPNGKHNQLPSIAIDVQTYPRPDLEEDLREEQFYLLGLYVGVLHGLGWKARTGADWDTDGEVSDNGFDDLFHVELVGPVA